MQNKGLIKLFAFLFGLVSIYQLSYTFIASQLEDEAAAYAAAQVDTSEADYSNKRAALAASYLDSISEQSVLGFTNYADAKKKELNKGLDLKGGINVTLQIAVKDILKGLANNSQHPAFVKAIADADALSAQSDDTYLDLFFTAFDAVKGDVRLSDPAIFGNKALSDVINFQMTDDQVKPVLRTKIDESIVSAFEVLRERIDGFGVTQPNIQRIGTSGRIIVELPGAKDINRAQELLSSTAQLEFWETFSPENQSINQFILAANEALKSTIEAPVAAPQTAIDSLLSSTANDSLTASTANPLIDLIDRKSVV